MHPVVHDFYNHLKEGKILGHRCAACGAVQFPPMGLCPECGTNDLSWFPLSGKGTLLFASVGRHPMMEITFLQDWQCGGYQQRRGRLPLCIRFGP